MIDDDLGELVRGLFAAGQDQFGGFGCLVGVIDAGETLEFAGPSLFIEALGVALFADLDGGIDEDLDKFTRAQGAANDGPGRCGRG